MSDIILHQYAASPFSEKIRLILGHKGLSYRSVEIPVIMPKPDLIPLTGGYRKTPVMQIGADVYCDTEIMARVIDHLYPQNSLYPNGQQASAGVFSQWTDSVFFGLTVAMVFQPSALASSAMFQDQEMAAAFVADRAELVKGGTQIGMPFEIAHGQFLAHLKRLDNQLLDGRSFLLGDEPCIADFSTYHCIWMVYNNEAVRNIFDPFAQLLEWRARMATIGHGTSEQVSGAYALKTAADSDPAAIEKRGSLNPDDIAIGEQVEVMPTDYGLNPVGGKLLVSTVEELAIARTDPQLGNTIVHFPRYGFQIRKA